MLYINNLRPGDIIIPGQLQRFKNDAGVVQLAHDSDAYTLIINDLRYVPRKHCPCFVSNHKFANIDNYMCVTHYEVLMPESDTVATFYEYMHRDYIHINTVNINCSNCVGCVGCFNCNDCENCENCTYCENCLDCIYCDYCKNCEDCKSSDYCTECELCNYGDNCYGCFNCKSCTNCRELRNKHNYERNIPEYD